jgi:hypothetical protein
VTARPFSTGFNGDKELCPGIWWLVAYAESGKICRMFYRFDDQSEIMNVSRLDHIQRQLEDDAKYAIMILSRSKFTVPEEEAPK